MNDYWCTYNEHDGCNYVKTGVQELTGQWNPSFWEGDTSCGAGGSSSLYGEKKIYLEDVSYYKIKAQVNIDDNSWVEINGVNVSGLQRVCCGWTSWVDVASSYFKTGWNTVKFRAEDTCSGNRYFDMNWDVVKDDTPPTTSIEIRRLSTAGAELEEVTGGWLRAGRYRIKFHDEDNTGGFGLDTDKCEYAILRCNQYDTIEGKCVDYDYIDPAGSPRDCNHYKDINIGPGTDYDLEGYIYQVKGISTDKANLSGEDTKFLPTDFTPPTTK